jgi:hypothetical protein
MDVKKEESDETAIENRGSRPQRSPRRLAVERVATKDGIASHAHKFALDRLPFPGHCPQ